ncbi:hypothetical protein BDU57DRAFT_110036 [Ampelomyces quisqualis]|uniref:Early meiotic induction protein 1 n=1 Tax=Ampelomyces quisqualis TaxID=50730 RepID=A0A6A5Q6D4_AMPQU|nr:hypothetical protein BDU57DRAFT_110036 [Ampelomyces quisqualis]
MSWWPFSSSGAEANAPQPQPQIPSQPPMSQQPESVSGSQPESAPHDPDFYAAYPHLAPPSFSTSTSPPSSPQAPPADDPLDPHLPRTMSCRVAFDSAFYCASLGGHFNDIYRYGQLRACSEHWNDFWFCMRVNNSYNPREIKEQLVQERYRAKEEKLRSGPNSEHVWKLRGEGERIKGAFGMGGKED